MLFCRKRWILRFTLSGNVMKKKAQICVLVIFLISMIYTSSHIASRDRFTSIFFKRTVQNAFLVNTDSCRIPDIDPQDPSIKEYITGSDGKIPRLKLKCNKAASITAQDGLYLRLKFDVIKAVYSGTFSHCEYKVIQRKSETSDSGIKYLKPVKFTADVKIKDEFVRVECYMNNKTSPFYTNFHAFIIPQNTRHKKSHQNRQLHVAEKLNVLMVGLDSVSRLTHMRTMPKVRNFLLKNLGAVELQGYTKVADNTFVNVVPLTTGKFLEELPWNETLSDKPMDKYNFIWKDFRHNEYATLYAEDAPAMATFNYLKSGFHKPPGLHYFRPFSLAMEETESWLWTPDHNCVGDRAETSIVMKYVKDFARTYRHQNYFSYSFISRLTHDNVIDISMADDIFLSWLQSTHQERLFNNSVLIFFSDHGMRFGNFRTTYIGRIEERLPMMYLVFPKWFHEKYPQISKNLKINSNRLTTPFDIYATLKHILYFDGQVDENVGTKQRGISLFNKVPETRTCEDAGILPHWCVCMAQTILPVTDTLAVKSAEFLLWIVNDRLERHSNCEHLVLNSIKSAQLSKSNDKVLRFVESKNDVINRKVTYTDSVKSVSLIQISVIATPGMGEFEATLQYDEKLDVFALAGDISRVNLYGHDADCVSDAQLRKLCYCKNNKLSAR